MCVCWSPDGKYAVTGGEDDLVTVWSFEQKRVVARGEGHKSYINAVAFDPFMTTLPDPEMASPTSSILPSKEAESTDTKQSTAPTSSLSTKAQSSRGESPTLQSHSKSTLDSSSTQQLNRYLSKVETELELNVTAYRLGSVGQDTQLCLWDLSGDALKLRRPFLRNRSQMSRHSRPVSIVDPIIDQNEASSVPASTTATTTETPNTALQQPNGPDPTSSLNASKLPNRTSPSPGEDVDAATTAAPVGNHVDASAKRTSLSSNRDSTTETGQSEQNETGGDQQTPSSVPLTLQPDDGRSSTPSTVSISSEKGNGKKEKKHKKEKHKDKSKPKHSSPKHSSPNSNSNEGDNKLVPKKSHRKSLTKMIKFVSNIGAGNSHVQHSYRRAVAAFETCMSDDIAPKMSEVNLIEPLVAKKITSERLTALVFQRDCIITACQEGFIHTWSRPGTELPSQAQPDEEQQSKKEPASSSVPSNPGVSFLCMF